MRLLRKQVWQVVLVLFATAAFGVAATETMPPPGTLNYIEGQVSVNGQALSAKSPASNLLEAGQVLETQRGNAELLLTPGVFLRVGHNSELRMISPELTDTQVRLEKGSAMVEVDDLYKENNIGISVASATATLEKNGLYDVNADQPSLSVLEGKARVSEGNQQVSVGKGHEVRLANTQRLKVQRLDKEAVESDPLYAWSKLRGEYASEANVETASNLMMYGGWFGAGWYWDPFWSFWAFLPGDGIWWGPFGWGFFSPGWVGWAPYYGYSLGYYHYPAVRGRDGKTVPAGRYARATVSRSGAAPRAMSSPRMGGFGMGGGMRSMGGFHGGFGGHRG